MHMRRSFLRLPLDTLAALMLLLVGGLFLLSLQNPTSLDDGLRHFTMASFMREEGILNVQGWTHFFYEGYLSKTAVDPWFLSDVILIPFTYFPIAKGLQLFIICEIALLFTSFLLVLRSLRHSSKERMLALLLLVFGDTQFMGRFLLGRPYALMTAMMLFVLWCVLERRLILLALIMALSVLLSQLFVFGLFICAVAVVTFLLQKKRKDALYTALSTIVGLIAGFLLHPEPLLYIQYVMTAFLRIPFLHGIGLSREMQSGITATSCISILFVVAFGILCAVRLKQKNMMPKALQHSATSVLSVSTAFLTVAFLFWVRAIDVLWPLILLWAASIYSLDRTAPREILRMFFPVRTKLLTFLAILFMVAIIAQVLSLPYIFIRDDASHSLSPYKELAVLPPNAHVLNLDWDKYFVYTAVRPDLKFAAGIDRTFTYLTDPEVSESIYNLEQGSSKKIPMPDIRASLDTIFAAYPSDYMIVSHKKFEPVIQFLETDISFERLANNDTIAIYAVPDWYRKTGVNR